MAQIGAMIGLMEPLRHESPESTGEMNYRRVLSVWVFVAMMVVPCLFIPRDFDGGYEDYLRAVSAMVRVSNRTEQSWELAIQRPNTMSVHDGAEARNEHCMIVPTDLWFANPDDVLVRIEPQSTQEWIAIASFAQAWAGARESAYDLLFRSSPDEEWRVLSPWTEIAKGETYDWPQSCPGRDYVIDEGLVRAATKAPNPPALSLAGESSIAVASPRKAFFWLGLGSFIVGLIGFLSCIIRR